MITANLRSSVFSGFTDTLNHNAAGKKQKTVTSLAGSGSWQTVNCVLNAIWE